MPPKNLWPRCTVKLENGDVVVVFSPRTLAFIERESGLSSMEFAEKFKNIEKAMIFDLGMKIIFGAVKSAIPDITDQILSERILPNTFMAILTDITSCWGEAVSMVGDPMIKVSDADPTAVGAGSPSST